MSGFAAPPRRYRLHIAFGSLLVVAAGFLPWWRSGGDDLAGVVLPVASGLGLTGPGVAAFAAAAASLVILDLGYLRGRWGFVLDTPMVHLGAGLVAAGAVGLRLWQLWTVEYLPLPAQSPGLVLAAVGAGFMLYGAGMAASARPSD